MQCTFEHLSGSKKGQVEEIQGDRIAIGRNPTNALQFDAMQDLDVSGDHAQMMVGDDGRYVLTDLNSKNGTYLNGQKIAGSVPVEPGSKVQFGKNGPEVKVHYVPGPKKAGATRMMLAQVQQELESQKTRAAESKKKSLVIVSVLVVVLILGGVGAFFYFQHAQKKQAAENAKKVAIEESERADNKGVKKSVPQDYAKAQEQLDLANKYMDDGDFENAAATYENAKKLFTAAIDHANEVVIARFAGDAEEREKRAQEEARRIREELERAAAEREKALQDQLAGLAKDSEEYKRALEEMAKRKSESERARAVVEKYEPSLCYISVESYVQPEKSTERSVIGKSEGTGFAIGENRIATAKHVVQPWKYDPKLLATAKKIKDEHKLDVKTYLEIYMLKGGKWTKVFESGKDTAKLLAVSKDTWEANERSVTIEWNQVETQLKVKVHDGAADDLAVIEVSGEKLAPVDVEPITTAKKFEPIIVLGTSSDAKKVLSAQVRAEVQDVSADALHLTTPMPANYAGGPLFTLDGKCIALVCGIQGQTVTCLPAQRAANLKGGGSTAPGGAAPGGEAETSGPK